MLICLKINDVEVQNERHSVTRLLQNHLSEHRTGVLFNLLDQYLLARLCCTLHPRMRRLNLKNHLSFQLLHAQIELISVQPYRIANILTIVILIKKEN